MMKHQIVLMGSGGFGLPCFQRLLEDRQLEITRVFTQPAKPGKRGLTPVKTAVADWAESNHLPLSSPASLSDGVATTALERQPPAAIIVIAYGLILPETILNIPVRGCLNVHASLLPKYRGAAPIAAAILNDDKFTGVSLMKMDVGIDTGPVIHRSTAPIDPGETAPSLSRKLADLAARECPARIVDWLDNRIAAEPQLEIGASYAKKISRQDGRADWVSGLMIARRIRAYQPWPGVWTEWQDKRIKILAAEFIAAGHNLTPGLVIDHPGGWVVTCADGYLRPRRVQFAGKNEQPADQVLNNYPGFINSRLTA